jgi:nucleotide-binding universal stress UspA family protein
MNQLTRLMVGLDLTEMDESLIRYAAFLSERSSISKVVFMHVEKTDEVPLELSKSFTSTNNADNNPIKSVIESKVKPYFQNLPHVNIDVKVVEGTPVRELLSWLKEEKSDLIIVGRKVHLRGSGILPQKLLRSGRISLLFVTENALPVLNRIVVAIDFSDYSMMALDQMLHSALNRKEVEIICLHAYEVPTGYITMGESFEAFDEKMQGYARSKFDHVLSDFPELGERAHLKLVRKDYEDDLGELIVVEARKENADLLVIGAKGKSAAALFILGSVTEKILRYNDTIPMVVFKNKNEKIGFLDALLNTDD